MVQHSPKLLANEEKSHHHHSTTRRSNRKLRKREAKLRTRNPLFIETERGNAIGKTEKYRLALVKRRRKLARLPSLGKSSCNRVPPHSL